MIRFCKKHFKKIVLLVVLLTIGYYFCLPATLFDTPTATVLFDRKGDLMGAKIAKDGQWRFPATDSVPHKFEQAIVAFEDKRFYDHIGVDIWAIARAIRLNSQQNRKVSGGSTLTMQTIRLAQQNPSRTIWTKVKEVILATRLEWSYSKPEILAMYASYAPFGGNVVGIDAAAWKYFGRNAQQLTWAESAMLAVLPNSPSLIHISRNRQKLLEKRNWLLDKLYQNQTIDSLTCELAKLEELPNKPKPLPRLAPHLLEKVHRELVVQNNANGIITSTLDATYQRQVNQVLQRHYQVLQSNEIHNAAALVIEVATGNILVYGGNVLGAADQHSPAVDIIPAPRSSGSILKPFLYAAMLQDGEMTSRMLFPDIPSHFGAYTPKNYDEGYAGAVGANIMLTKSLNIPAVHMLQQYGIMRFSDKLKQVGMTTLNHGADHYGLTLILGGAETSLWDLGTMYSGMARNLKHFYAYDGKYDPQNYRPLNYLKSKSQGQLTASELGNLQGSTPLGAAAIWHTFEAMQEVVRPGEEVFWKSFPSSQKVAWKTGTSFGFRDAWAVGCTPEYVVAVWVGNADGEGRPGLVGVHAAAPILFDIFQLLPSQKQWFDEPFDDQKEVGICQHSGQVASTYCTEVKTEWQPQAATRSKPCPYHQRIHLTPDGKYQVNSDCFSPSEMQHVNFFVLPPAMSWYYQKKHPQYQVLPPFRADCTASAADAKQKMALIYPLYNTKIYIPTNLDATKSRTVFEAKHSDQTATIYWHLDKEYIGKTTEYHSLEFNPTEGKHQLTLVDETGETITRNFEIITTMEEG